MIQTTTREQAHKLIDRIDPSLIPAAIELLQPMLDPLSYKLANAPLEDEIIDPEEEQAAARARLSTAPTTSMEDLLAEYGLTIEELEAMDLPPLEVGAKTTGQ